MSLPIFRGLHIPLSSTRRALRKGAHITTAFTGARLLSSAAVRMPRVIRPSTAEIKSSRLNERNLELAVRSMHEDGLVVVEDVVPHEHLDHLNEKMVRDARELQARGEDGPFNYNVGNLQQDAPPWAEYFYPSVFTNRIATQITSSVLGPRPRWTFCSANAAMPALPGAAPARQPVHSDADFAHPSHPFALVVNVPLVDMTPDNGSTEIWLGTHSVGGVSAQEGAHGERASGRILESRLTAWQGGPCQPTVKKGSVVVRDLRLWHAGMPNRTADQVRVMLAMIHFAAWYRNPMRLEFADDIRPVLEGLDARGKLGLELPVDWVPKEVVMGRYLNRGFGNSYDFNQAPVMAANLKYMNSACLLIDRKGNPMFLTQADSILVQPDAIRISPLHAQPFKVNVAHLLRSLGRAIADREI
ncbi:hypothetical protein F4810DRAFT_712476 [Camillea tinctor]|nr:hypothetical protein F4810DRAFT_712476 [Camillea tinctor]